MSNSSILLEVTHDIIDVANRVCNISTQLQLYGLKIVFLCLVIQIMWEGFHIMRGATSVGGLHLMDLIFRVFRPIVAIALALGIANFSDSRPDYTKSIFDDFKNTISQLVVDNSVSYRDNIASSVNVCSPTKQSEEIAKLQKTFPDKQNNCKLTPVEDGTNSEGVIKWRMENICVSFYADGDDPVSRLKKQYRDLCTLDNNEPIAKFGIDRLYQKMGNWVYSAYITLAVLCSIWLITVIGSGVASAVIIGNGLPGMSDAMIAMISGVTATAISAPMFVMILWLTSAFNFLLLDLERIILWNVAPIFLFAYAFPRTHGYGDAWLKGMLKNTFAFIFYLMFFEISDLLLTGKVLNGDLLADIVRISFAFWLLTSGRSFADSLAVSLAGGGSHTPYRGHEQGIADINAFGAGVSILDRSIKAGVSAKKEKNKQIKEMRREDPPEA